MLVYLLDGRNYWLGNLNPTDVGYFRKVGQIKKQLTAEKLCEHEALCLKEFASEVFQIQFSEEPNYAKLKHLLAKVLLEQNQTPNQLFDWSTFKFPRLKSEGLVGRHESGLEDVCPSEFTQADGDKWAMYPKVVEIYVMRVKPN